MKKIFRKKFLLFPLGPAGAGPFPARFCRHGSQALGHAQALLHAGPTLCGHPAGQYQGQRAVGLCRPVPGADGLPGDLGGLQNYPAPEGYYFLDYFQEYPGDADAEFVWGYYPPNKFYVLLYNIETGTFYRSQEPVERYAFSSEWQVLLDSQDGLRVHHNRNDSDILSSFAARVLITLILELTWGILLFGLRGPAQRALIGKVNLATQIILNLGLCYGTLYLGPMLGNFLYFALEVLVFSVEAFVYNRYLPWPEGKKPHPILYALTANLLSFGIGLELNTHCTNTQIRLIGLICLVLWYAGPWLCRKLRKVQNAQ